MKTTTRIYVVINRNDTHLVEAGNITTAIRHVVRKQITAHVATQKELIEMTRDGVEVEIATGGGTSSSPEEEKGDGDE